MINTLQLAQILYPEGQDASEIVSYITDCINNTYCPQITINISRINLLDSCYISTLCSSRHFLKYPDGKIQWIIGDSEVEQLCKPLNLGNCTYKLL